MHRCRVHLLSNDRKLEGVADTPEDHDAMWKDFARLEKWADGNFMIKKKCRVLLLGSVLNAGVWYGRRVFGGDLHRRWSRSAPCWSAGSRQLSSRKNNPTVCQN